MPSLPNLQPADYTPRSSSPVPAYNEDRLEYVDHVLNQYLAGEKPKPLKKGHQGKPLTKFDRKEKGMCTACRKPLRQIDGRTFHKIGTFKKGESCPSGTPRVAEMEYESQWSSFSRRILGLEQDQVTHWDHEVDVPDYCFIEKEFING